MRIGVALKAALASALLVASAISAVLVFSAGPAGANAANPDPTTTGSVTLNNDGTVTVDLSGTWTWASQSTCTGRYGEGWAVDWWGLSSSATPANNFTLTDASIVSPPGTTTTGSITATGTAPGSPIGGNYFHVGDTINGEVVNSVSGCTVTAGGITGPWSASATYPAASDVPPSICVNLYDLHFQGGSTDPKTTDFDPGTNDDNSIKTNTFDPTSGSGYCLSTTTTVTHDSASTVVIGGGTITDNVTVTGQTGEGLPTGTVDFYVCGPTQANATCSSTSTAVGTPSVPSNGDTGIVSTASSTAFAPPAVGTWCFAAVFVPTPGSNYAGSGDNQGGTAEPNECFTATAAQSTTTTQTSATTTGEGSVVIGPNGAVTDTVTVTGVTGGGVPSGTVSFYVCGPSGSNQFCSTSSGTAEGTPTLSGTGITSTATSSSFLPTKVGTYCFSAVYTPDSASNYSTSNDNVTGNTPEATECFQSTPADSVTTTQTSAATSGEGSVTIGANGTVTDTVTVTGNATAGAPDGTVAFYVCGPASANQLCTSSGTAQGTPTLNAATSSTSTATSTTFTPTQPGTYCFGAVYTPGTGSNYLGSTDNVTGTVQANECLTVSSPAAQPASVTPPTSPPPTTTTTVPAAQAAIAFTGADISAMAGAGAALLGLGGALVLISRRRRRAGSSVQ